MGIVFHESFHMYNRVEQSLPLESSRTSSDVGSEGEVPHTFTQAVLQHQLADL